MEQVVLQKIEIGATYTHAKTGNEYIVVDISKMKHPDTGKWLDSVVYKSTLPVEDEEKLWTRSLDSFKANFVDGYIKSNNVFI